MVKSVFKEILITILLCVAIILILSILFYDYNPINKVIPNKIAYSVPDNIKNELEEKDIMNTLSIENKVYTIDSSDLNLYKKSDSYATGNDNPFATASTSTSTATSTSTSTSVVNTNTNNSSSNNSTQSASTPSSTSSTAKRIK